MLKIIKLTFIIRMCSILCWTKGKLCTWNKKI